SRPPEIRILTTPPPVSAGRTPATGPRCRPRSRRQPTAEGTSGRAAPRHERFRRERTGIGGPAGAIHRMPGMARRTQTLLVAAALALVLGIAGLWLPVPFVTLAPGPVTDTLGSVKGVSLIDVNGRATYPTSGRLELTTVEETPRLNLLGALEDWLDSDRAVVPRELIQPPGASQEEIQQENTQEMLDSQTEATVAALTQLGIKPTGTAVVVYAVPSGSPASGKLESGDVITAVDGTAVHSQVELRAQINKARPGEDLKITYRRGTGAASVTAVTTGP